MSFDYTSIKNKASATIKNFGQEVIRISHTVGSYDTTTGEATPNIRKTKRHAVVVAFGDGETLDKNTLVQNGDIRILLDATATVDQQDHFIVQGIEYTIVTMKKTSPSGTICLFDIHLRT